MNLGVDHPKAAVVAIDLHRGHLDMAVATMPTTPRRARPASSPPTSGCSTGAAASNIPIIHLVTSLSRRRGNPRQSVLAHPRRGSRRPPARTCCVTTSSAAARLHGHAGAARCQRDLVVNTKKRYDCFLGTDLDFLLRSHGINTLLITGVNTNSCVLATTTAANVRDYAVIVVEDCVDSMDGPALHERGLACIKTAFGFVMDTDAVMALDALAPRRNSAA